MTNNILFHFQQDHEDQTWLSVQQVRFLQWLFWVSTSSSWNHCQVSQVSPTRTSVTKKKESHAFRMKQPHDNFCILIFCNSAKTHQLHSFTHKHWSWETISTSQYVPYLGWRYDLYDDFELVHPPFSQLARTDDVTWLGETTDRRRAAISWMKRFDYFKSILTWY